ncbi:MAG: hypothetical protein WAZ14_03405 [Patescibacteria group bacterium]
MERKPDWLLFRECARGVLQGGAVIGAEFVTLDASYECDGRFNAVDVDGEEGTAFVSDQYVETWPLSIFRCRVIEESGVKTLRVPRNSVANLEWSVGLGLKDDHRFPAPPPQPQMVPPPCRRHGAVTLRGVASA